MSDPAELREGILSTDFYQLTAAQVYWRQGLAERRAQFDWFFRSYPDYGSHRAGYCVSAGLPWLLDWMRRRRFDEESLAPLREHRSRSGDRLFDEGFLDWLAAHGDFSEVELLAVPEGRVVHPHAPLALARGPLAMLQILETPLLLHLNYPTLIATKAARMREVIGDGILMEFGARRGHERGAHAGARAALIGGADFTSNTGISYEVGLPPKGTHAHALVQAFLADGGTELDAFRAFARSQPDDCILLVDTVDTLESGVPNAIRVFEELREQGHEPVGVRLDSGDLAYLAVRTARMLDDAGFDEATIVLSNQLDELVITEIHAQIRREASQHDLDPERVIARLAYGVGTSLISSKGDSALDGVYKLTALEKDGEWQPVLKISETPAKIPHPGPKSLLRLYGTDGKAMADVIATEDEDLLDSEVLRLHHVSREGVHRDVARDDVGEVESLLTKVFAEGRSCLDDESIEDIRRRRRRDLERLHAGVKRTVLPHVYHVSSSDRMWKTKRRLVHEILGEDHPEP